MSFLYSISKTIICWISEKGKIRISTSIATLLINLDFLKLFLSHRNHRTLLEKNHMQVVRTQNRIFGSVATEVSLHLVELKFASSP